ncbi:MAG: aminotransferase class I/II-fold pyridoxal phosphate-dependent enzyme [Tepidibacter sp.]|uniref:pyridoxal phosphate-dependent aminotransferase n=1 Tax=Tepidibacter sp. TaxID=2529387 RepID=UPI0025F9366E|nr:aminotransferase class I/II-fold pyridoxal phosphate-dependent enzyme [Tepidibacter sp.]MCT4509490.1 aminotransferase class I/II-fold pyridoxal phosphate-dependent enzyme [Tepidibacter sp.]
MIKLGHGADVNQMMSKYNKSENILDFSSNINPYTPENIEEYVLEGLKNSIKYPDIEYLNLRKNISSYININDEYIIPGNGASEIIYMIMKILDGRLATLNPTFSEYERAAFINNLDVVDLYLGEDFKVDIKSVENNIDKFDFLFICNPNNPSGNAQELVELLDLLRKHDKFMIVDETFMEFVYDSDKYSLVRYIDNYSNLFIIKAVTKFFGLPGIRLGYGITSNKDIIYDIWNVKEPWTVNAFAENISKYIFKDKKYIRETKGYFKEEISYMLRELNNIDNIECFNTDTNFILLKLNKYDSKYIKEKLFIDKDVLIRDASNFKGLDEKYIRVAVKKREENKKLITALREIMGV